MATVNFINRKKSQTRSGMKFVLLYTQRSEKTQYEGRKLISAINCSRDSVYEEFVNTKLLYGKDDGRMYYHFVQSFPPNENITPQTAHEIAVKLAEYYNDFEVLVATHVDREHIHSHFVINSVGYETGKKLHQSANAIQELRDKSDALCLEYGLSVCQPQKQRGKPISAGEYHSAVKGDSWKMRLMNVIDECMKNAKSKNMFIKMMESEGYSVKWTDTRKNITYTTPEGKRCRDDRLHESKYLKEVMEREFRIRQEIITRRIKTEEQSAESDSQLSIKARGLGRTIRVIDSDTREDENVAERDDQVKCEDEQLSNQYGIVENSTEHWSNPKDIITGWEQERKEIFNTPTTLAECEFDSLLAVNYTDGVSIGDNLVQLGRSVEQFSKYTPLTDATTKPITEKDRKKKLAVGQKEDDHSEHDFDLKM